MFQNKVAALAVLVALWGVSAATAGELSSIERDSIERRYAFYQAASLLEQLSMAVNYLAQECRTEIETLCSNVKMGEGRILACLDEQTDQVGEGCKKPIADTVSQ